MSKETEKANKTTETQKKHEEQMFKRSVFATRDFVI